MTDLRDFDAERRRVLRKVSFLTWGLLGGAVVLAIGGGALVAWFFAAAGLPFLRTWVVVSVLLLGVPSLVHLLAARHRPRDGGGHETED